MPLSCWAILPAPHPLFFSNKYFIVYADLKFTVYLRITLNFLPTLDVLGAMLADVKQQKANQIYPQEPGPWQVTSILGNNCHTAVREQFIQGRSEGESECGFGDVCYWGEGLDTALYSVCSSLCTLGSLHWVTVKHQSCRLGSPRLSCSTWAPFSVFPNTAVGSKNSLKGTNSIPKGFTL